MKKNYLKKEFSTLESYVDKRYPRKVNGRIIAETNTHRMVCVSAKDTLSGNLVLVRKEDGYWNAWGCLLREVEKVVEDFLETYSKAKQYKLFLFTGRESYCYNEYERISQELPEGALDTCFDSIEELKDFIGNLPNIELLGSRIGVCNTHDTSGVKSADSIYTLIKLL